MLSIIAAANLFCAGLLAGEEFIVCYGVRGPLASLEPAAHIQLRQRLIRPMRILVPIVLGLTILSGMAVAVMSDPGAGRLLRYAALAGLAVFVAVTFAGTVPINQAALAWDPQAPPADWRGLVARWERLDIVRAWAAMAAFALFVAAGAVG